MTDTAAARPNHDGRRSCLIAAATRSDVAAPAITRRGRLPRVGHTSFRAFVEVFGVIYTTNAIGATVSGKAIRTEGRFPDEGSQEGSSTRHQRRVGMDANAGLDDSPARVLEIFLGDRLPEFTTTVIAPARTGIGRPRCFLLGAVVGSGRVFTGRGVARCGCLVLVCGWRWW